MVKSLDPAPKRPNIYDVAHRAGVSHQTVSRVLNRKGSFSEATRARVLQVASEMNYTPNLIAHTLATRHIRRIGILADGFDQDGPDYTLRALEIAAREVGYGVSSFYIGDGDATQVARAVADLLGQGVGALCVIAPRESSLDLLRQHNTDLPIIVVTAEADPSWHTAGVDQRGGARLAVDHLIELGHRTIAHLGGPDDRLEARQRAQGWRDGLTQAGLPEGRHVAGNLSSEFGFEFGRSFDLGRTTAIFAASDQSALGVIHGFFSRGIRVPEDISVVGFDDLPDVRHLLPPLTTIRQDFAALGSLALRQAVAAVEENAEPSHHVIQPTLTIRESTTTASVTTPFGR